MPLSAPFIAGAVNPVLLGLLAAAPFWPTRAASPWGYWGRSAAGLGLAVALAESGKHFVVWPEHPGFPSGHQTFCLSVATSLVLSDRRWLAAALPLTVLLAWALVDAHFHQPEDIAGAILVGPPPTLLCHFWLRGKDR